MWKGLGMWSGYASNINGKRTPARDRHASMAKQATVNTAENTTKFKTYAPALESLKTPRAKTPFT